MLSMLDTSTSDADVALALGGVKCLVRALKVSVIEPAIKTIFRDDKIQL